MRVRILVAGHLCHKVAARYDNPACVVTGDDIVFDNDVIARHHQNACSRWDTCHQRTGDGEVRCIVIGDEVTSDNGVVRRLDGQPWRNKYQDATRIVSCHVAFDQYVPAVFYFDACDIIEYLVVADVDVIRHADVNGSILDSAQNIVLDEPVVTELREDAV